MIKFDLQRVFHGWNMADVPDDVDFAIYHGDEEKDVWASVADLVELYFHLDHEQSGEVVMGNGLYVRISPGENTVRFGTGADEIEASLDETRGELAPLIGETFAAKDEKGHHELRADKLRAMEQSLERKGAVIDLNELYGELTNQ